MKLSYFLKDTNECESDPCDENQECINKEGSFECKGDLIVDLFQVHEKWSIFIY